MMKCRLIKIFEVNSHVEGTNEIKVLKFYAFLIYRAVFYLSEFKNSFKMCQSYSTDITIRTLIIRDR